ncbi:MAG: glycosyltransferase [Candidatus Lokiarchaeota archaeon]|nr:glycosyltransferase [Candidatus Lokiarchaeota archaeon]
MPDQLNNLKFINFIKFTKINNLFRRAKIFINTSQQEGFTNTFIQAMKNCTPIISLSVDPDAILLNNRCGYNYHDDFNRMKKYLKYLLENRRVYKSMSKNALTYVSKNHNLKDTSKSWNKIIKFLIKTRYYNS